MLKKTFSILFSMFILAAPVVEAETQVQAKAEVQTKVAEKSPKPSASLSPFGEYYGVPKVLSDEDVALYKKMFRYQRAGMRQEVVALLPKLNDGLLMGHLIAERLLHPSKKASYADLQKWLARYNDHGPAPTIYKLANTRKPKRASHQKPEVMKASIARYSDVDAPKVKAKEVPNTRERRRLLQTLKTYRQKQYYTKSMNKLHEKRSQRLLGEDTWAQVSLRLSRAMMADDYFGLAHKMSSKVVATTKMRRSEALWISGLSSYLSGDKKSAAGTFRRLAYSVPVGSRYFAQGAFWAGRAYETVGEESIAKVFFNLAARDADSFYGLVASEKVGQTPEWNWKRIPSIKEEHLEKLYNDKLIRRVIALAQMGEIGLAQKELKMLNGRLPYELDPALLALSVRLGLPNTSMTLAFNLEERGRFYATAMYPVMRFWQPTGGFQMDKSLMHAIVRQESAFKPAVKSRAGARGLMQLMPATAKYIRKKNKKPAYSSTALYQPFVSLGLGQDYMNYLHTKLEGNLIHMVAAYNAGPGNVNKWVKRDIGQGDPILFVERIPFRETKGYVQKVLRNYWMYQSRFGAETPALASLSQNKWPVVEEAGRKITLK